MTHPIVIIGGQAAGLSAAMQIRRRTRQASIRVFERGAAVSYSACGLPFLLNRVISDPEKLKSRTIHEFSQNYSIDIQTEHEVVSIFPAKHSIVVRSTDQTCHEYPYSKLVIATGAHATVPLPFSQSIRGVFLLREMSDALKLVTHLESVNRPDEPVAIIGAGPLGIMLASVLLKRTTCLILIESASRILSQWDESISEQIAKYLSNAGVRILTGGNVQQIDTQNGSISGLNWNFKEVISAKTVILATGVQPSTGWIAGSGVKLAHEGAICVNRNMETSCRDIYAAGDCAATYHRILKRHIYLPHGTTANRQGQCAANNLLGFKTEFAGTCGAYCMKIGDLEIARTGLTGQLIGDEGIDACKVTIDHWSRSPYYPGSEPIRVILFGNRRLNRVIGCEMIGKEGVGKRIDVVTTAISNGMSPQQLADVDYAYSPPLSPEKDPVMLAALKLDQSMNPRFLA